MKKIYKIKNNIKVTFCLMITAIMVMAPSLQVYAVTSATLKNQAEELKSKIADSNSQIKALQEKGQTLQNKIAELNIQIDQANREIELTAVKLEDLQIRLRKAEDELVRQKALLKAALQAMYERRGGSTVEMLLGSQDFTEFIESQEYLEKLQQSVKNSADEVLILKSNIETERNEQARLLEEQKKQKELLQNKQNEQAYLLDQTKGDEVRYTQLKKDLETQHQEVMAQFYKAVQLEAGDGTNGNYPYANSPFSMTENTPIDRWGYYTRQCVSYAAWAVEREGGNPPVYYGNARDWPSHHPANMQGKTPRKGAVGVWYIGYYGHVVYVEDVYNDGTIRVSQYNARVRGEYSEATVSASQYNVYLYF